MFRTISDLLAKIRETQDPFEIDQFISEAADQAGSVAQWRELLNGARSILSDEVQSKVGARALFWAREHRDLVTALRVVVFQAESLRNPAVSMETLRMAARMVWENPSAVDFGFVSLEDALTFVGAAPEVRPIFDAAWQSSWIERDVEGLCGLALVAGPLLSHDDAIERLARVEYGAAEWDEPTAVIDCWRRHGMLKDRCREQQAELERADRFVEALRLADYWNLSKLCPGATAAFARAAELATTAPEWFDSRARPCGVLAILSFHDKPWTALLNFRAAFN
jgi:hypothetical protein